MDLGRNMVIYENVSKIYQNNIAAVNQLNLHVKKGEFVVLIGPSGCGKTTTLKMVNRIIPVTSGKIYVDGTDINELNPIQLRRGMGYVIQNIGLLPHKTVAGNIAIVPRLMKWERKRISSRIDELLKLVDMEPDLYRERFPAELSGGQQQRIGVLRALAADPEVLLMDEPFGALDPITRDQLQDELKNLQKEVQKTIIFVTHDIDEALKIADRIVIMQEGMIVQEASPEELLEKPANDFVRSFIGEERLIRQPGEVFVSEVMSKKPIHMNHSKGLRQGLEAMRAKHVDSLMITDSSHKFLGVVSFMDIQANLGKKNYLWEVMKEKRTVTVEDKVTIVIKEMLETNTNFIPVVDETKQIKGIVTRSHIVNFILEYL